MEAVVSTAHDMITLSQVMEKLRTKGWDKEFQYSPKGFYLEEKHFYDPASLSIIRTYRFEGDSNPSDSSILYIIRTQEGKVGYLVDAYGVYSNHDDEAAFNNYIRAIPLDNRSEQLLFDL
jgi:hypothetical protein